MRFIKYKKLDLPRKNGPATSICLNTKKGMIFPPRTIAKSFKKHFANHASYLVKKLPDTTATFGIPSVRQYYKGINFCEKNLKFKKVSSVLFPRIQKELKTNKTTGVENLAGRFLKDGLYTYS